MRREILLSKNSTFTSLKTIANNVSQVIHSTIASLPEYLFVSSREIDQVTIACGNERISFSKERIKSFDIVPLTHCGIDFYAATIDFYSDKESLRYGIIVSPRSELCWLRTTAEQIGEILGIPPIDRT